MNSYNTKTQTIILALQALKFLEINSR